MLLEKAREPNHTYLLTHICFFRLHTSAATIFAPALSSFSSRSPIDNKQLVPNVANWLVEKIISDDRDAKIAVHILSGHIQVETFETPCCRQRLIESIHLGIAPATIVFKPFQDTWLIVHPQLNRQWIPFNFGAS